MTWYRRRDQDKGRNSWTHKRPDEVRTSESNGDLFAEQATATEATLPVHCGDKITRPVLIALVLLPHNKQSMIAHRAPSPPQSRQHLCQSIDLRLGHFLGPFTVLFARRSTKVRGARRSVLSLQLGRLERGLRAFGDGAELKIFRFTSTRLPDGRRPKYVSYGVGILAPRQLIQFPWNTVHDLDILGNVGVRRVQGRGRLRFGAVRAPATRRDAGRRC